MPQTPSPHPPRPTPGKTALPADPVVYAGIVDAFLHDRNPIQLLVGDMQRMLSVLLNLGKNRDLAQQRIQQLQEQISRVESQINTVNPQTSGQRLNRLR